MVPTKLRPRARRLPAVAALAGVLAAGAFAAVGASPAAASPVYHDTSYMYDAPPVSWGVYEDCPGCGYYEHWYDAPPTLVSQGYYTYSPDNTVLPTLSGTAREKSVLSADKGTWTNDAANSDPINTYTYQWQQCAADGTACSNISGATAASYMLPVGAANKTFRAIVRASNQSGQTAAFTAVSSVVTQPVPTNTIAPSLPSADPVRGTTVTATKGTWDDAATAAFSYQWQRCTTALAADCADIPGATAISYTPVLADVGKFLRLNVSASNPGTPTTTAASDFTGKVKEPADAGSTPNGGGGGAAPSGGGGGSAVGGGGGGTGTKPTETPGGNDPTSGGGGGGGGGSAPKPRGSVNGDCPSCSEADLEKVELKAVFTATKTDVLSTTYGKGAGISGRLTTKAGDPIKNAWLRVTAKVAGGGSFDDHNVRTAADGSFTVTLARNVLSQTVKVAYLSHMQDDAVVVSTPLTLNVKATASFNVTATATKAKSALKAKGRAKRRSVARNGSWLTFRAQVDGPIPVGGKTVQLQSQCTAKGCSKGWANFGPSGQRTDSKGRFVWRTKTNGTVGKVTYRFRIVVPQVDGASNDWPFTTGYSPTRALTIHGGR